MQTLGALLGIIAPLLFVAGLVAVVKPSLFRLRKRRHALALWWLFAPIMMVGDALDPQPKAAGQTNTDDPLAGGIVLWLIGMAVGWAVCRVIDRAKSRRVAPAPNTNLDEEVAALRRIGSAPPSAAPGSSVAASMRRASDPAPIMDTFQDDSRGNGTDDRDNFDFTSGLDEGEWGAILRRCTDGRPLSFEYADRYGEVTGRLIFDWVEYPRHVQGMCSSAGAVRCFKKERVVEWQAGSDRMLRAPKGKSRR